MGRYRRVSFLAGLIMFPALLFAQFNNNTTSPYSRFGLGELHSYSFGRTTAMGGASLASRYNAQINTSNPASYTAIDSLSFLFEFGIDGRFSNFQNDLGSTTANDINFQYFAMSFQINNRIATSLGLLPYSDIGYSVEVNESIDEEYVGDVLTNYYGAGTVSNAYWGIAVEPIKNISVGVHLNYLFGKLNRNAEVYFRGVPIPDSNSLTGYTYTGSGNFYTIQQYSDFRLRDFGLDFGLQATIPLKNDQHIVIGAVFENKPEYTALYSDITQKNLSSSQGLVEQDTLNYVSEEKSSIDFPLSFGGGISYVRNNKLEINLDYYHQSWSDAKFFGAKSDFLTDLNKFAVGGEWIPNKFSIRSYLARIAYRAGVRYEETYLMFGDQQINDFGISFGVGLPIYRSSSTINVAAEIGKKGTKENGLVLENYARLNLSVNLYDLWFVKRRFD